MARFFSSSRASSILLLTTGVQNIMQTSNIAIVNAFLIRSPPIVGFHRYSSMVSSITRPNNNNNNSCNVNSFYFWLCNNHQYHSKVLFSATTNNNNKNNNNKKKNNNAETKKVRYNKKKNKDLFRADRVLSNRGMGTRKESFALLKERRIMMINEETGDRVTLKGPSDKIPMNAKLLLDGTHEVPSPPPLLYIYHKPKNMLSAMKEDSSDKAHLGQVLAPHLTKGGMHPVGRLDYDTSGLLLFSSNGDLTQRLLHPRHAVEKEYVATVENDVDINDLRHKLQSGVETSEGIHTAKSVSLEDSSDVRLVVQEGKYRMVRRMLANCGHPVLELRRERHGEVYLDDLEVGQFRDATEKELKWAESILPPPKKKKK